MQSLAYVTAAIFTVLYLVTMVWVIRGAIRGFKRLPQLGYDVSGVVAAFTDGKGLSERWERRLNSLGSVIHKVLGFAGKAVLFVVALFIPLVGHAIEDSMRP